MSDDILMDQFVVYGVDLKDLLETYEIALKAQVLLGHKVDQEALDRNVRTARVTLLNEFSRVCNLLVRGDE